MISGRDIESSPMKKSLHSALITFKGVHFDIGRLSSIGSVLY